MPYKNNSTGISNFINREEAGNVFREVQRGWASLRGREAYAPGKVTALVDALGSNPRINAQGQLAFPNQWARLHQLPACGDPDSADSYVEDTILHEYGHFVQFDIFTAANIENYGKPASCTCKNHGGEANDCSHDALLEGWAQFFPVSVYKPLCARDVAVHQYGDMNGMSLEDNKTFWDERVEWPFARVLWDIQDAVNEAGDDLTGGRWKILSVLRLDRPVTVEGFFNKYAARYPTEKAKLAAIYKLQGLRPEWLSIDTSVMDFGETGTETTRSISNAGWYANTAHLKPSWTITESAAWLSVSTTSGVTLDGAATPVSFSVDRSKLSYGVNSTVVTVKPLQYGSAQTIMVKAYRPIPKNDCVTVSWGDNGPSPDDAFQLIFAGRNLGTSPVGGYSGIVSVSGLEIGIQPLSLKFVSGADGSGTYLIELGGGAVFIGGGTQRTGTISGVSNSVSFQVDVPETCSAPAAPTGLAASDGSSLIAVNLSWNGTAGASLYEVYRHTSNNPSSAAKIGETSSLSFSDTGAAAPAIYWYWVVAQNAGGGSDFSSPDTGWRDGGCISIVGDWDINFDWDCANAPVADTLTVNPGGGCTVTGAACTWTQSGCAITLHLSSGTLWAHYTGTMANSRTMSGTMVNNNSRTGCWGATR